MVTASVRTLVCEYSEGKCRYLLNITNSNNTPVLFVSVGGGRIWIHSMREFTPLWSYSDFGKLEEEFLFNHTHKSFSSRPLPLQDQTRVRTHAVWIHRYRRWRCGAALLSAEVLCIFPEFHTAATSEVLRRLHKLRRNCRNPPSPSVRLCSCDSDVVYVTPRLYLPAAVLMTFSSKLTQTCLRDERLLNARGVKKVFHVICQDQTLNFPLRFFFDSQSGRQTDGERQTAGTLHTPAVCSSRLGRDLGAGRRCWPHPHSSWFFRLNSLGEYEQWWKCVFCLYRDHDVREKWIPKGKRNIF